MAELRGELGKAEQLLGFFVAGVVGRYGECIEVAGLLTPTRLTSIYAAFVKCRLWHVTVGSSNPCYLSRLYGVAGET